jgi:hypothetical protein
MRNKIIALIYLMVLVFLLFYSRIERLDIFVLASDFFDLLLIFMVWTLLSGLLYMLIKRGRRKNISNAQFYSFWIIILICASINFQMIKYNPHPYDTWFYKWSHKDFIEQKRINDSLEIRNGKPDSTIETTIASLDSSEVGVYIWLNHKRKFVRKLTPEIIGQRQNDSLTMSIVRTWKKE